MSTLSDRINEAMASRGMTITDVARVCGISYQAAKKWTTGESTRIEAEHLWKFCDYTSYEMKYLLTGTGERVRYYAKTKAQAHTLEVMQAMSPEDEYRVPEIADLLVKHEKNGTR